jgi:sulfite exporter TauE/SafE
MDPTINKTGRAVTALVVLAFCLGTIAWLVAYGSPANSLHQSALSWSYTPLCVALAALGLNVTVDGIVQLLTTKSPSH